MSLPIFLIVSHGISISLLSPKNLNCPLLSGTNNATILPVLSSIGQEAVTYGLINEVGGFSTAINKLRSLINEANKV